MAMWKSLLLATDFRPASEEAANVAVQLASRLGSRITLLHVLESTPHWPISLQERQVQALEPLGKLASRLKDQKVDVAELPIVEGPTADTIVQQANALHADVVLVGAGELSRFDRYSVGPVAAAVIEHATQPVLAVHPGSATRFGSILCAVDQSAVSAYGLRYAVELTRTFGGQLVVLTVVPEVTLTVAAATMGHWSSAKTRYESEWHGEFERFLHDSTLDRVQVTKDVRHGKPHEQIVAAAKDHRADLIVMGATGRTGMARLIVGSTTRRVLERLPCSLLTVKCEGVR